ncbi:hypothetical protein IW136_000467 [Coemansia sp. RSA 678]|nr:hypothetical protein IW136_000467 [Coemansia sp. RSA 678]
MSHIYQFQTTTMPQLSTQSLRPSTAIPHLTPVALPASQPWTPSLGARILKTFVRARDAILHESPPVYMRGAWAIINDVPYPPPPPYASSRHPPTYDEAMEIGVVASPMRVEQQMQAQSRVPRVASAPQLSALADAAYDTMLPPVDECVLPSYAGAEDTELVSPVVQGWRLGESAFEKPPMHPKGYTYATRV